MLAVSLFDKIIETKGENSENWINLLNEIKGSKEK